MVASLKIFLKNANRSRLVSLILVVALAALFEVLSVASIMPFMALLSDPEAAFGNKIMSRVINVLGMNDQIAVIGLAGALTLSLLVLSNGFAISSNWLILRFVHFHGHLVSSRLLAVYLNQPYRFFLERNSSDLQKNVVSEVRRVTSAILLPLLQLVSKLTVLVLMIALLFIVQPVVSIVSALTIGSIYALIFWLVRRNLTRAGLEITASEEGRFKVASEALAGVKEIKVSDTWRNFQERYEKESSRQARNYVTADVLTMVPKNVLELIAFSGIVIIAMYLVVSSGGSAHVLPIVGLYAFSGYRILPAVQQIYSSVAVIRFNMPALGVVTRDLDTNDIMPILGGSEPLVFEQQIKLTNVTFRYGDGGAAIDDVSLSIERNATVGFVGKSGAGKSTLIDIILGLLQPSAGSLAIDGAVVTPDRISPWQATLGYVPQQIYLTDGTIASNVAFGIPQAEVNSEKVAEALDLADLSEYVASLPKGVETLVGDRGLRLSGGQRQRIGIARALYRRPRVLILDEATSALDNLTERVIVDSLDRMAGKMTIIIIAHRLTSLKHSNRIFFMQDGRLAAQGTYDELYRNWEPFRLMVDSGKELV